MKTLLTLLTVSSSLFSSAYDELDEVLPLYNQQLSAKENKIMLDLLIRMKKVSTAIEIGSWTGGSTIFIAKRLPPGGKLYAIDTWEGTIEQTYRPYAKDMLPTLYEQFLSNVIHKGLTQKVIPLRMTSLEGAELLRTKVKPDLIYIDGAHDEESVYSDLCAWYPFIKDHAVICGDDWNWVEDSTGTRSVRSAVKRFTKERGISLATHGTFWYFL